MRKGGWESPLVLCGRGGWELQKTPIIVHIYNFMDYTFIELRVCTPMYRICRAGGQVCIFNGLITTFICFHDVKWTLIICLHLLFTKNTKTLVKSLVDEICNNCQFGQLNYFENCYIFFIKKCYISSKLIKDRKPQKYRAKVDDKFLKQE